jgi:23S rRNA (uracil1939-C5)-methyltransferase
VNDAGNAILIEKVISFAAPKPAHRVADLYAGAGNLTLPLARRAARVLAVERNPAAGRDLHANCARLRLENVSVVVGDVAPVLERWAKESMRLDAVVLDPPRSGAAAAMPALVRLAPPRIVYVSCNPATLGRDIRLLSERYRPSEIQSIDFFPQTPHVECVALLVRRGGVE